MRKLVFLILIIPLLIPKASYGQTSKHIVIISIDGFRPDFYLDPSWGMVNLRIMMKEGVYAKGVNSVFPSLTFPNHTSIVTGVPPAEHGVFYNVRYNPTRTNREFYWYYKAIKSPTLWDAVHKVGLTSASVNWPVSVGAPIDYNIPAIKKPGMSQIEATIPYCTPEGLLKEVQNFATGKLENEDFDKKKDYLMQDQTMARIGGYLIRKYKPTLTTIHLSCVDHFEHREGRDGDMVRRAVSGADLAIRTIVESIERAGISEKTAIIVTGDHGHVNTNTVIRPNVWLSKAGLITDLKTDNWEAQFNSAGGSAFLYLKDPKDSTTLAKVESVITALPNRIKRLFRIIDKDLLGRIGADPRAALSLSAVKGFAFSNGLTGSAFGTANGATHGHFPNFSEIQTGFVAYGAGIKKNRVIPEMDIIDIAPMVAYLLGIDFPSADGILIKGALE